MLNPSLLSSRLGPNTTLCAKRVRKANTVHMVIEHCMLGKNILPSISQSEAM